MALVKMYRVTGKEDYLVLAKFMLDERGPVGETVNPRWLDYNQAQTKVIDQTEPVGHAVRAMYMYAGMADVAALEDDGRMRAAGEAIWNSLVKNDPRPPSRARHAAARLAWRAGVEGEVARCNGRSPREGALAPASAAPPS